MEEKINNKKNYRGLFVALSFFVGTFVGIVSFIILSYFNVIQVKSMAEKSQNDDNSLFSSAITLGENEVVASSESENRQKQGRVIHDTVYASIDTTIVPNITEKESLTEVEFSIENPKDDITVAQKSLINSKTVKLIVVNSAANSAEKVPPPTNLQIELQQWSTPIKNRMEFFHTSNIIKLRGIDISDMEVYFDNGNYYIISAHKKYAIPMNKGFEKLTEIVH